MRRAVESCISFRALQGQPFCDLNQQVLDQASALVSRKQCKRWFHRKTLLGFAQPALGFLVVPKHRLGHGRHVCKTEQAITLAWSQALTARDSLIEGP